MPAISAYSAAAVENSTRVVLLRFRLLVALITVIHIWGLREVGSLDIEPRVWLRACVSNNSSLAEPSSQVCLVQDDINFTRGLTGTAVVPQSLAIIGIGWPTVNLSGAVGLFAVASNATVSVRLLRLVDAVLEETILTSGASFLNLLAFTFSARNSGSGSDPPQQQPTPANPPPARLSLEDVEITTRSCQSLSILQAFACKLSPSPNFTVTPRALVVHSYTHGSSLRAHNVTLGCSGAPLLHPCSSRIISSGPELLDLLSAATVAQPIISDVPQSVLLSRPLYVYISRNITLRDAWLPPPPPRNASDASWAPGSPPPPAAAASLPLPPSIPIYAEPLVLSGGTIAATAEGTQPPVAIDLAASASLFSLATFDARLELHNLTLVNLPLGPATTQNPHVLLALPIWTLDFPRNMVGWKRSLRLLLRGVAVQLDRSELALWHQDMAGSVPDELAESFCAWSNRLLRLPVESASELDLYRGVQLFGGGLFLRALVSVTSGLYAYDNVLLLAQPFKPEEQQHGQLEVELSAMRTGVKLQNDSSSSSSDGLTASEEDSTAGTAVVAAAAAASTGSRPRPLDASPLCQLRSERGAETFCIHMFKLYRGNLSPSMITQEKPAVPGVCTGRNFQILFIGDAALQVGALQWPVDKAAVPDSFRYVQAEVIDRQVLLGLPRGDPRLLHMSFAPSAINLRAANASITLKQLVLSGLPAAGLHPSSAAWGGNNTESVFSSYGASGWTPPPPPAQPLGRLRRRGLHSVGSFEGRTSRDSAEHDGFTKGGSGNGDCSYSGRGISKSGCSSRSSRGGIPVDISGTVGARRRRLAQQANVTINNNRTGAEDVGATGGLATSFTNFISCVWSLDFDRLTATSGPAGYRAFLDSVVLLVPPGELALMAWVWVEQLARISNDSSSSSHGLSATHNSTWTAADSADYFTLALQQSEAAAAGTAADVLEQLHAMPVNSRLSSTGGNTVASLARLTRRLLIMETARQEGLLTEGSDPWWQAADLASGSIASTPASLTFDTFSWCGLLGRNVTLLAEPLPWLGVAEARQAQLWLRKPLELPLVLELTQHLQAETTDLPPPPPLQPQRQQEQQQQEQQQQQQQGQSPPAPSSPAMAAEPEPMAPQMSLQFMASTTAAKSGPPKHVITTTVAAVLAGSALLCLVVGLGAVVLLRKQRLQPPAAIRGLVVGKGDGQGDQDSLPCSKGRNEAEAASIILRDLDLLCGRLASEPEGAPHSGGIKFGKQQGTSHRHPHTPAGIAVNVAGPAMMWPAKQGADITGGSSQEDCIGGRSEAGADSSSGKSCRQQKELVLLDELGRGAQGVVYRGLWRGLDVAVKSVLFQVGAAAMSASGGGPASRRPIQEAAIAASLNHPNVVATYSHRLHLLEQQPPQMLPDIMAQQPQQQYSNSQSVQQQQREQEQEQQGSHRAGRADMPPEAAAPGLAPSPGGGLAVHSQPTVSTDRCQQQAWKNSSIRAASSGVEAGVEAEVWRLTLVLELCDSGSLRQCLDSGLLAGCSLEAAGATASTTSSSGLKTASSSAANALSAADFCQWRPVVLPWLQQNAAKEASCAPSDASVAAAAGGDNNKTGATAGGAAAGPAALPPQPPTPPLSQPTGAQLLPSPSSSSPSTAGEPPAVTVALAVALQAARGMEYLHSVGVLHGDLSSANVLLQSTARGPKGSMVSWAGLVSCGGCGEQLYGYGYVAKVADFGLSGWLEDDATHLSGECRRSSLYSAPELVQNGICSKSTDVYAFAVLLYEVFLGKSLPTLLRDPQLGGRLREWMWQQQLAAGGAAMAAALPPSLLTWPGSIPPGVVGLVSDCLAADPAARPSFGSICRSLQQQLNTLLPV